MRTPNSRIDELEEALSGLLEGLDSNATESGGLSSEQWECRITEARRVLDDTILFNGFGDALEEEPKP